MIDAADAVAKAEDFGRRVGGVAPGAGLREIAPAGVPGLEIAEDDQRCLVRGRIGASIETGSPDKWAIRWWADRKAFFSGIDSDTCDTRDTCGGHGSVRRCHRCLGRVSPSIPLLSGS